MNIKKSVRLENKEIHQLIYLLSKQVYLLSDHDIDFNKDLVYTLTLAMERDAVDIDVDEFDRLTRGE